MKIDTNDLFNVPKKTNALFHGDDLTALLKFQNFSDGKQAPIVREFDFHWFGCVAISLTKWAGCGKTEGIFTRKMGRGGNERKKILLG